MMIRRNFKSDRISRYGEEEKDEEKKYKAWRKMGLCRSGGEEGKERKPLFQRFSKRN